LGENMHKRLLEDLKAAEHFIFMEYFIIEEGEFWDSILDILLEKAASGVEVKLIYDDIGCMMTLPGDYARQLRKLGIAALATTTPDWNNADLIGIMRRRLAEQCNQLHRAGHEKSAYRFR